MAFQKQVESIGADVADAYTQLRCQPGMRPRPTVQATVYEGIFFDATRHASARRRREAGAAAEIVDGCCRRRAAGPGSAIKAGSDR
jgi:hypothetical protein